MRRWRCGSRNPSQRWRTDERQWRGQFSSFGCFVTDRFQQFQKPIDFVCGSRPLLPIRHRQSSHIPSKVIAQQRRKITHRHKTIHLSGFHVDKKKKRTVITVIYLNWFNVIYSVDDLCSMFYKRLLILFLWKIYLYEYSINNIYIYNYTYKSACLFF